MPPRSTISAGRLRPHPTAGRSPKTPPRKFDRRDRHPTSQPLLSLTTGKTPDTRSCSRGVARPRPMKCSASRRHLHPLQLMHCSKSPHLHNLDNQSNSSLKHLHACRSTGAQRSPCKPPDKSSLHNSRCWSRRGSSLCTALAPSCRCCLLLRWRHNKWVLRHTCCNRCSRTACWCHACRNMHSLPRPKMLASALAPALAPALALASAMALAPALARPGKPAGRSRPHNSRCWSRRDSSLCTVSAPRDCCLLHRRGHNI
mmetsp:Transcript_15404/g.41594  ORF Transcript_15404/g.41594 Transcript_15404/m.41594 type:complete len:258 (-) Transcript_15404:257-1030(-)